MSRRLRLPPMAPPENVLFVNGYAVTLVKGLKQVTKTDKADLRKLIIDPHAKGKT